MEEGEGTNLRDTSESGAEGSKRLSPCRSYVGSELCDFDELGGSSLRVFIGPT